MAAQIVPADFEGLALLCWNRSKTAPIDRETAWALYRANWRFVWQETLADEERALIESLEAEFGNGERLLGTDGPPPPFARRVITPEEAAEILGIDVVLLERRVRAGKITCHQIGGKREFDLSEVLALKEREDARHKLMVEIYEDMENITPPKPRQ